MNKAHKQLFIIRNIYNLYSYCYFILECYLFFIKIAFVFIIKPKSMTEKNMILHPIPNPQSPIPNPHPQSP